MDGQEGETGQGVLQRLLRARNRSKTELGRAPLLPVLPRSTPAQAAGTAIGRIAETLYQLPLKTDSVALDGASLAELPELLPEGALLIVLQGAGEEMGVMALCRDTVMALIEIQTLSRVTARPVPPRKLTRADALMCAEFANALIAELGRELAPLDGFNGIGDFRYATHLEEPRPLALILEDRPFRSLSFRFELGDEPARKASIFLALPNLSASDGKLCPPKMADLPVPVAQDMMPMEMVSVASGEAGSKTLAMAMQEVPVDVVGVLCRRRITLRELRALKQGQVLSLPRVSLSDATLELAGGQVLARGKLGEAEGCHALRLHDPDVPVAGDTGNLQQMPMTGVHEDGMPLADLIDAALPVDLTAPDEFLQGGGEAVPEADPGADNVQTVTSGAA
ncbi:flagellar motor switch protein FliM [Paracoccus saliphilus]|nr:flagellar motor switch protein FliM [Paracoccus saliphilus]